jgi:hypothetical protein
MNKPTKWLRKLQYCQHRTPIEWHCTGHSGTCGRGAAWELAHNALRFSNPTSKLHAVRTEPGNKTPHYNLNRRQVINTRLRTGHSNLTHTHLLAKENTPACNTCDTNIHHYEARPDCHKFFATRQMYGIPEDLQTALNDSSLWRDILQVLKHTDLYDRIWYSCNPVFCISLRPAI